MKESKERKKERKEEIEHREKMLEIELRKLKIEEEKLEVERERNSILQKQFQTGTRSEVPLGVQHSSWPGNLRQVPSEVQHSSRTAPKYQVPSEVQHSTMTCLRCTLICDAESILLTIAWPEEKIFAIFPIRTQRLGRDDNTWLQIRKGE
ncbi:unnamed protein product, partial [Meganyctiphanes norvegica]